MRLLTQKEVAARLQVSPTTIGAWLREGKLQGVKVGRLWRVAEDAVNEFIAKGRGKQN